MKGFLENTSFKYPFKGFKLPQKGLLIGKGFLESVFGGSVPPVFDKLVQWLNVVDGTNWLDGSGVREGVVLGGVMTPDGSTNYAVGDNNIADGQGYSVEFDLIITDNAPSPSAIKGVFGFIDGLGIRRDIYFLASSRIRIFNKSSSISSLFYEYTTPTLVLNKKINIKVNYNNGNEAPTLFINGFEYVGVNSGTAGTYTPNKTYIHNIAPFINNDTYSGIQKLSNLKIYDNNGTLVNLYACQDNGSILRDSLGCCDLTVFGNTGYFDEDVRAYSYADAYGYNLNGSEKIPAKLDSNLVSDGNDVLGAPLTITGKVNYNAVNNVTDMVQLLSPNVFALDSLHDTPFFYSTDGTPLTKLLPSDFDFINYEAKNILFVKKDSSGNVVEELMYKGITTDQEVTDIYKYLGLESYQVVEGNYQVIEGNYYIN